MRISPFVILLALGGTAGATTASSNVSNSLRAEAATDASLSLLIRVDEALNAITYTTYSALNYWDDATGVFKVNCSQYVNRMLEDAAPSSYDAVSDWADKTWPLARDYVDFLRSYSYGETAAGWTRLTQVSSLRPGDVIAWRYPVPTASGATGHVVVVVGLPVRDTRWSNAWRVRIADATSSAHSADSRCSTCTGVGAGEILLRASSSTGKPYELAWSTLGLWRPDVTIALGRPAD